MVIVLYGPDSYARHKKATSILEEYTRKQGVAPETFDLEMPDAEARFKTFVTAPALFAGPRLGRLMNLSLAGKDAKQVLKTASESVVTVLIAEPAIPADFKFLLKAPNKSQKFDLPKAEELVAFVIDEAKARGVTIEKNAARFLGGALKGDTWGIVAELEKLSLGKEKEISVAALRSSGLRAEYDFWAMVSGWERRPLAERLTGLETLLASHEDPAKIFNLLAYGYGNPARPRRFADYDLAIKSGKLDYEEAVLDFALSADLAR